MAETTEQLQETEQLEAQIDALLKDVESATETVRTQLGDVEPAAGLSPTTNQSPAPSSGPAPLPAARATTPTPVPESSAASAAAPSPDEILKDVAAEIAVNTAKVSTDVSAPVAQALPELAAAEIAGAPESATTPATGPSSNTSGTATDAEISALAAGGELEDLMKAVEAEVRAAVSVPTPTAEAASSATIPIPAPVADTPKAQMQAAEKSSHEASPAQSPQAAAPAASPAAAVTPSTPEPAAAQGTKSTEPAKTPVPADKHDDLDTSSFVSPETVMELEAEGLRLSPADAAMASAALDPNAPPVSTAKAVPAEPSPTIEQLDTALAAGAGKAVEAAITDAAKQAERGAPAKPAHQNDVAAPAASAPAQSPTAQTTKHAEPAKPPAAPTAAPASPEVVQTPEPSAFQRLIGSQIQTLAELSGRIPDSTRQTMAYVAVMTVFFAASMWGIVLLRKPHVIESNGGVPLVKQGQAAPSSYDATSPREKAIEEAAHAETAAPAAAEGEGHGGEHGAKKPEAKGKKEEKKKDEHGADKKKAAAKAEGSEHH